jgi:endonuclease YncB( thermonuclease family)
MRAGILAAALALAASSAAAQGARVVDGDTLELSGAVYRLHGIDAPEEGQSCAAPGGKRWACGREATKLMEQLVAAGDLACKVKGNDDYSRIIAVCRAGGIEINRTMVERGLAWSFRRYSHDYNAVEDAAREAGLGVWRAATETPWDYRARRWAELAEEAPSACPIKGNVTRQGERIYHTPWSPWYARTRVNEADGERWFCSEAEAVAAGWRAARWGK